MAIKAWTLTMTSKGKNPIQFIQEIQDKVHLESQGKALELAEQAAEEMREIIKTSKKRPSTGETLEEAIEVETLRDLEGVGSVSIGICKIVNLPKYYLVLNDGGYVPPTNLGYWVGGIGSLLQGKSLPNLKGETWIHTGSKGDFLMKPAKAIEGIDYIGISARHLQQKLETDLKEFIINQIDKIAKTSSISGIPYMDYSL